MLQRIHSSHLGTEACIKKAKDRLIWPNMGSDIRNAQHVQKWAMHNKKSHYRLPVYQSGHGVNLLLINSL